VINDKQFYISETFDSIQGEGNCAGALSFFIRFQYCNLTCSWCDSKFTWGEKTHLESQSAIGVKDQIRESKSPNVILTGGEPALYQLDELVVDDKKFHVETNGTIIPTEPLDVILQDGTHFVRQAMDEVVISKFNWVVSPKMQNAQQQLDEKAVQYWASKSWCIFKFIIQNKKDLDEVEAVVNQFQIDKNKTYIGLEGNTLDSQLKPELVDQIIEQGYNYSPRLHILLWGAKRKK